MFSILKRIFKPSSWRFAYSKIVGTTKSLWSGVRRGSHSGWGYVKKMYAQHPGWFISIGSGIAVSAIWRGISLLMQEAETSSVREKKKYGDYDIVNLNYMRRRDALLDLINASQSLKFADDSGYAYKQKAVALISAYHAFFSAHEIAEQDFLFTSDLKIGGLARLGLQMEVGALRVSLWPLL